MWTRTKWRRSTATVSSRSPCSDMSRPSHDGSKLTHALEDQSMNAQTEVTKSHRNGSVEPSRQVPITESALRPTVDIYETGEGIVLQADMPGVSKDRLSLRVE